MNSIPNLIVMMKNPIKGKAKSRLAKDVGIEEAHQIYLRLVAYTQKVVSLFSGNLHIHYAYFIDDNDGFRANATRRLQVEGDLTAKLSHASESVSDYPQLFIGSDCAQLTTEILEEAADLLTQVNVVLGPSHDGGYYLIGMDQYYPELFQNIDWSTDKVLEQTISKATDMNLSFTKLSVLSDIDDLASYQKYGQNIFKK